MAHHAYFTAGEKEAGIALAQAFVGSDLGSSVDTDKPDIVVLQYGLFSVDDARKLTDIAYRSSAGGSKVIIASMSRFFHEAQNALLKLLEEPPEGVTIILNVPSEGIFIPTLRSRLLPLPTNNESEVETKTVVPEISQQIMASGSTDREKLIAKLVERTKSDKDEVKQAARHEAVELLQGLTSNAYSSLTSAKGEAEREALFAFLEDLSAFMPLLYERSAPIKLMFEHLLLVIPKDLSSTQV